MTFYNPASELRSVYLLPEYYLWKCDKMSPGQVSRRQEISLGSWQYLRKDLGENIGMKILSCHSWKIQSVTSTYCIKLSSRGWRLREDVVQQHTEDHRPGTFAGIRCSEREWETTQTEELFTGRGYEAIDFEVIDFLNIHKEGHRQWFCNPRLSERHFRPEWGVVNMQVGSRISRHLVNDYWERGKGC